ncbi:hypothetical protein [Mucilaginibacter sp. KACC 22063]|uniref:hypothetical protein n=1 Tax=Mucilaginibacter sp. KACC 22063 TaxID=3025666 RepID=UPI0023662D87|nr:hypothetical protein [Mucilaginibacter sp. KACC 22063]WDF56464.1 hypothetical protein PQ461_05290 [Mucilaginibacter sp. KACC 22063]
MEDTKIITGNTEEDVWSVIAEDLSSEEDLLTYDAEIHQGNKIIQLFIDIDLGGGFEGGSEFTQLVAPVSGAADFRFAIHEEHFVDEIGKFLGMQDVTVGYPELDNHIIIKTNNQEKIKKIFEDTYVRELFTDLSEFDFGIHEHCLNGNGEKVPCLELNIDEAITDPDELRKIYHCFYRVLNKI